MRTSTVAALSILVAVVTAHPYAGWNNARYRWNDLFAARDEEIGARIRSQTTVESSSCTTVTYRETRNEMFHMYRVRVCSADPEDFPNKVCLDTRVNPCCPIPDPSRGTLASSANAIVNGENVTVKYYLTQTGICFRLDNAHLRTETCSQPIPKDGTCRCSPECSTVDPTCFNNTLTGDISSCDGDVCQCKTGYLPPDCCQCDTTNFYLPDCRTFCRDNCRLFRPNDLGGCQTCRAGFTGAPECCQCEPGKTEVNGVCKCDANREPDGTCAEGALESDCCECDTIGNTTHAFYKNEDDECIPFCKINCAVIGSSGCTTCKTGFMTEPKCCQCEPGRTEVNGVCKCDANLKPDGTCAEGALEPDCCECDTAGNATHAFYKTPSGECKPYCDNNCAGSVGFGCSTCKIGFMSPPECCQCVPGRDEVAGVCKCRANLKPDGTCAEGALEPDCCECDTTGNATHAFYKNKNDECIPFCKSNCAVIGSSGCTTCKTGFMREPHCCECVPGRDEVAGVCKCRANLKPDGTCAEGALEPDCCECDTTGNATHAFYRTASGECIPFCKSNCAVIGSSGCTTCKTGFITESECCQCEPGRTEVNGVCKCDANLKPDGTCAEGALEPDCCECDTAGNATHAFYKNKDDECIPFCKSNCAVIGSSGCTTCSDGFDPESDCCQCKEGLDEINGECKCRINTFPNGSCIVGAQAQNCCLCVTGYQKNPDTGKCEPEKCDKQQTLYFYVDATRSNTFENFCPLIVVIQMLVAAFNPSATSGTKINALLFPYISKSKGPSPVFNTSATCLEAIQGQNGGLRLLLSEFGKCRDKDDGNYFSADFPSSCAEGTSAVKGLEKIYDIASSGSSSAKSALLMFTDGRILDDPTSLAKVLQNLNSVGVRTLIAAGINEGTNPAQANRRNLQNYTSDENILIEVNATTLGLAIVRKLEERKIICKEHADNITASLKNAQEIDITLSNGRKVPTLDLFCSCHRKKYRGRLICTKRTIKYPTCGGDISIGVPLKETDSLDSLILEKEILAAVESVLEKFEG